MLRRTTALASVALLSTLLAACSSESGPDVEEGDSQLTSLTGRQRDLTFDSYVYVSATASDFEIESAITRQNQSAFGALRTADIGVNRRELKIPLKELDPKYYKKTTVTVVNPAIANDPGKTMTRVQYRYTDLALVPPALAKRSSASVAVLVGTYQNQADRILKECTENQAHDIEFRASIWYVFNPSLSSCKAAISKEQATVDADRKEIGTLPTVVPLSEVTRLYRPMTVRLGKDYTNAVTKYPEYDRLYSGGVKPGRLVVGMVSGLMADWAAGEKHDTVDDDGWKMWFQGISEIQKSRPNLKLTKIEPQEDLTKVVLASGKTVQLPGGFQDLLSYEVSYKALPGSLSYAETKEVRVALSKRLVKHWLTFEAPVTVQVGTLTAKPFVIELDSYFGAETDPTPHKRAIKNSDVFVYNGHSYIGYGPLDPKNFSASDFPSSYQIMFVNGCVSYNYYERDYFPLKGGTKSLDLVTNGLESWVNGSGGAMGRFVGSIINGKQSSYPEILKAAQFLPNEYGYEWGQDALRVVDGELDNTYTPTLKPISVK